MSTGTETLVTNIQGGTAPLAVLFDFEDSATIILTESAVTTVDDKGSVQTTVKQQDGLVVSIGYQRNTTELFGIRENSVRRPFSCIAAILNSLTRAPSGCHISGQN
jgi:hypothetical protein